MGFELPDFEEMLEISDEIGRLTTELAIMKEALKAHKAMIARVVIQNPEYWHTDKTPAWNYIEGVYHSEGFNDKSKEDLVGMIIKISELDGELERQKMRFRVMSDMIDVWKADQYNKNQANY